MLQSMREFLVQWLLYEACNRSLNQARRAIPSVSTHTLDTFFAILPWFVVR